VTPPDLNYHHLLCFWAVAREGGVGRAAELLGLGQPTVSTQVGKLQRRLRGRLLVRDGRGLRLTDLGRAVFEHADEIVRLGRAVADAAAGGSRPPARLAVGVSDVLPKLVVCRLLEPVYAAPEPVRLVVTEDKPDRLLAELAVFNLDLLLTDTPPAAGGRVRAFHHLLGECGTTVFAAPALARRLARGFPKSLDAAPFLLPADGSGLRRGLDDWFAAAGVRPAARGEFADTALVKAIGEAGVGAFALPAAVEADVLRRYAVRVVGHLESVRQRFFAVTADRKLANPAAARIAETARAELFGA
jgi:LysR family transcriptional activator of nhaA